MYLYIAAIVFSILTAMVVLFQLALALGFPWGEYAMGGKFKGKFPLPMRIAAVFQMLILIFQVIIVISKARLSFDYFYDFSSYGIWFVVGLCILATIINFLTKSVLEKRIWAPVSVLLLFSSFIVAIG